MKKILLVLILIPLFSKAQGSSSGPSDTLILKSPNGTLFGLYITNSGVLEVVNFNTNPNPPGTPPPSVGFPYSDIIAEAARTNITPPSAGLQALQQAYFNKLDSIGFLAKCDFFYVFPNDGSEEFGLINWADPAKYKATTKGKPLYDNLKGFTSGPKSNGYIRTHYKPSKDAVNYTADNASFGGYLQNVISENGFAMGINGNYDNIVRINNLGTGAYRVNNTITISFPAPTDTNGFFVVDRQFQQLSFLWRSQVINSTVSITPSGLPDEEFYILCQNLGGSPNSHTNAYISIAFAGGNSKILAPAVTQFTEDYLAAVRMYHGLPPVNPQTLQSTAFSKEDILTTNDMIRGYNTNLVSGELIVNDLYALLDTSDVRWSPTGELLGVKKKDPVFGWEVRFEAMKQSFKNPVEGIIEWKYPSAIDSIALWIGNNLKDTANWFQFFGSNDMVTWYPITGKINYSFTRKFIFLESLNKSKFRYFKATRQGAHNFMKIIPFGRQDKFLPFPGYVERDSLRIRKYTFAQTMGISAYTVDSLNHVTKFKNVSQFNNFKRYMARPGDPWGAMLNYFSAYATVYSTGVKHRGPDGLPVRMLRGGMEDVYEYWRDHGVDFVFERFQLNTNAWLADSLNQYYITPSGGKPMLSSEMIYVTDRQYSMPENIRGEPQQWVDTIKLQRNLTPYDYRKSIYEAYDSIYPPRSKKSLDYLMTSYIEKDSHGNPTGRVTSIQNYMRIPPEAIIDIADPQKRFAVLTTPETYELWGDFIFNYTAVTGRNKNIPPNDVFVIKGDSTLIGLDIVDAQAGENEADRDWQGGLAQMPDYAIGMMLSVQYDGHLGLVGGIRGNHAVGMHTADSSMKMVIHSTINSDMHRSIRALKWAEYFRQRDMHLTTGIHPYSGKPLTVKFDNVAFDFHEYRSTAGGQGSGVLATASKDYALTPELSINTDEMIEGLRIIRSLWPDYEVYCSEYGYGHLHGGKFAARKDLIGIFDSSTNKYTMDPDFDLTYAQASYNDWDSMFRHGYLEKIFIYRLKDADNYYAQIDQSTSPPSIDRQAVWDAPYFLSSFVSHGLYTHTNSNISVPKPAAYSMHTLLDVIGNSYQIDYVRDDQDSVAMFKYFDFANQYWTYAIRRYTNHNGKTFNYTIDIPKEVRQVTRIEPVRNGPNLTTISLGDIEKYTTTITEKYFLLKLEI